MNKPMPRAVFHTHSTATVQANGGIRSVFGNSNEKFLDGSLFAALTESAFRRIGETASVREPTARNQVPSRSTEALNLKESNQSVGNILQQLVPPFEVMSQPRPSATFAALQEWEGYVVSITDTHLVASLVNLTAGSVRANEEAEIPLTELSDTDIKTLKPGRIFRWAIGYRKSPTGTKMRVSQIVFRELPQWTSRDVDEARTKASELRTYFGQGE